MIAYIYIVLHACPKCSPHKNVIWIKSWKLLKSLSMSRRCSRGGLEIWDMRLLEEEEYDCVIKGEKKIFRLIC